MLPYWVIGSLLNIEVWDNEKRREHIAFKILLHVRQSVCLTDALSKKIVLENSLKFKKYFQRD